MLDCFIPLGGDFGQALLCVIEKCNLRLFTSELLLELFVLLEQEVEGILQVLVTVDEHLVVLIQVVDQVLDEEQVIRVEGR